MDAKARDEHLRRLQRVAYGAVASDADRASALAELERLRHELETEGADAATEPGAIDSPLTPSAPPAPPATSPIAIVASSPEAGAFARRFRWAIGMGTAALLIGIGVGWHFGTRAPIDSDPLEASAALSEATLSMTEPAAVPINASVAARVFEREPDPADALPAVVTSDDVDPASSRLLLTRPDGVTVHAARAIDGANVCVVVVFPQIGDLPEGAVAMGSGSSCTESGMFPGAGLTTEFSVGGRGSARATWSPDGSVSVSSVNGFVPGMPTAAG